MVQYGAPNNDNSHDSEVSFPYRIASRYHCTGYLGSGGSGLVFKAWDDLLNRSVAIKFIKHPSFVTRQRLVTEARSLARVNHPSLCSVYDIGEPVDENSSLFMVMELIEGARLSELAGQINVETAVRIVTRLAEGVSQLHAAGLVHNDINPANVIIKRDNSDEPTPTLIDLSIANLQSYKLQSKHPGFGVTPLFGAPEQRDNKRSIDNSERVDIYSLGALLFFLITGQAPSKQPERKLKEYSDRCPKRLRRIILRCIEDDPDARYPSALALAQELAAYRYQRYPWIIPAVGVICIGLIVSSAVGLFYGSDSKHFRQRLVDDDGSVTLTDHALAHALYSQSLVDQGNPQRARQQARLAIDFFKVEISRTSSPLDVADSFVPFLESVESLFTLSESTAILLDATAVIKAANERQPHHRLQFLLAQIYQRLAATHKNQPHLRERWHKSAMGAISRALAKQPTAQSYRLLKCQLLQSNGGTC